jgi:hypothetical protein
VATAESDQRDSRSLRAARLGTAVTIRLALLRLLDRCGRTSLPRRRRILWSVLATAAYLGFRYGDQLLGVASHVIAHS